MELREALSQISEIHAQMLKSEVFRGYRAATMLVTAAFLVWEFPGNPDEPLSGFIQTASALAAGLSRLIANDGPSSSSPRGR